MKTFNDLKFKPHTTGDGLHAVMLFENGYGVSVVRFTIGAFGYGSYTDDENEWEVAIIKGTGDDWDLTHDTPISNGVIGHLNDDGVTDIMRQVQELKP
jgi:hypothetical protein